MKKKVIITGIGLILIGSCAYYFFLQAKHIENNQIQDILKKTDLEEEVLEEEETIYSIKSADSTPKEKQNNIFKKYNQTKEEEKENPQQETGDINVDFEGMIKEINDAIDESVKENLPEEDFEEKGEILSEDINLDEKIKEIETEIEKNS